MRDAGLPSDHDLYLFAEGTNHRAYRMLGAHPAVRDGGTGTSFAVWAPNAEQVSVIGEFNRWKKGAAPLRSLGTSGVWHAFVPGVGREATYKYHLRSRTSHAVDTADPFGILHEPSPRTASVVWHLDYRLVGHL